jgi:hypothetical protein
MEPLSITAAVVTLIARFAETALAFNSIRTKYNHASVTITSIATECTVVGAALSQIQTVILRAPQVTSSHFDQSSQLATYFETAITACAMTLSVLHEEVNKLVGDGENFHGVTRMARVRYIWNEAFMSQLLQQIRGLHSAINLLLNALQL